MAREIFGGADDGLEILEIAADEIGAAFFSFGQVPKKVGVGIFVMFLEVFCHYLNFTICYNGRYEVSGRYSDFRAVDFGGGAVGASGDA